MYAYSLCFGFFLDPVADIGSLFFRSPSVNLHRQFLWPRLSVLSVDWSSDVSPVQISDSLLRCTEHKAPHIRSYLRFQFSGQSVHLPSHFYQRSLLTRSRVDEQVRRCFPATHFQRWVSPFFRFFFSFFFLLTRHLHVISVGSDISELSNGPGSYNVIGNVWQLSFGAFDLQRIDHELCI